MHANEFVLSVIQVVCSFSKIEIEYADGIDLFHLVIFLAQRDVLSDSFRHTVEDTFKVIQLACQLYLDDDDFSLAVLRLDVDAIELVVSCLLVAFALEDLLDMYRLIEQYGYQPFEYAEVSFIAQHALGSPVESDVFILLIHNRIAFCLLRAKIRRKVDICK